MGVYVCVCVISVGSTRREEVRVVEREYGRVVRCPAGGDISVSLGERVEMTVAGRGVRAPLGAVYRVRRGRIWGGDRSVGVWRVWLGGR